MGLKRAGIPGIALLGAALLAVGGWRFLGRAGAFCPADRPVSPGVPSCLVAEPLRPVAPTGKPDVEEQTQRRPVAAANAALAVLSPVPPVRPAPSAAAANPSPVPPPAPAARLSAADVFADAGDLSDPAARHRAVEALRRIEDGERAETETRARALGLPLRIERPDGTIIALAGFDRDRPLYRTTLNANAAISTAANLVRLAPYSADGAGYHIGIWDGGPIRISHQEFGGRATTNDVSPYAVAAHATHVAGTLAAAGITASAKGMAPAANVDSYDWDSDKSEMTAAGASYPGEIGKIYISNHSYTYLAGWAYTTLYEWYGTGATASGVEDDFGKYGTYARDADSLAYSLPYYLIVRAAGNERSDNPSTGATVTLSPGGTTTVAYNPALHPPGDNVYRGGYDTLGFDTIAKNVVTIGAVNDAVTGGVRDPSKATMTSFSSWGPTDDGRIKPDLVANGAGLYSTTSTGDTAYTTMSGTSMAAPNAAGTAMLLVDVFGRLFPGQALRAATLKALLIHTANDLGTTGPDYQFGWGLINAHAAAALMASYHDHPGARQVAEDRLTTSRTGYSRSFTWDGSSPIRATLCWTDPAGSSTTSGDSRTKRLVNDLNLVLTGPGGTVHRPFVMPYVGDWTTNTLAAAATTGTNTTDNVEQVLIVAPPVAGTYTATVTFAGTLTNGAQPFSLIVSGGAVGDAAPAPTLTASSPQTGTGTLLLTLTGGGFQLGAAVKLTLDGQPDVVATGVEVQGDIVKARVNVSGMAAGQWSAVVTNPDGQSATLAAAFLVAGGLWNEDFETDSIAGRGWTLSTTLGVNQWVITAAQCVSPTRSMYASGPSTKSDFSLVSPSIAIPSGATGLRLSFWQNFSFQSGKDGGVLEFSLNGGAWFDVTSTGSGASFAASGYTRTISSSSSPINGRSAWSGSSGGWQQVFVDLTDAAKYAGQNLRARWRVGTNTGTASAGWYVDDVLLSGATPANLPPSILTAASATPSPATGTTTALTVSATDDGGEAALTYTWTVNDTLDYPVVFSENGNHAASQTTATFSRSGEYAFHVVVRDAEGLTSASDVTVVVEPTASTLTVAPADATVQLGQTQAFTAEFRDQFGLAMALPPVPVWSVDGGGTIDTLGRFTAGGVAGGPFTITATGGGLQATASVRVDDWDAWAASYGLTGADALPDSDPDDDGMTNTLEKLFDFAPDDPASRLRLAIRFAAAGDVGLRINQVVPQGEFRIQWVADLDAPWTNEIVVPVPVRAADYPVSLPSAGPRVFYRLRYEPE